MINPEIFLKKNMPSGVLDTRCIVQDVSLENENETWVLSGWVTLDKQKSTLETNLKEQDPGADVRNDIKLLPDEALGENKYGLVSTRIAPIWGEPKEGAERVNESLYGHGIRLLREVGNYYLGLSREGYVGYFEKKDVSVCDFESYKRVFNGRQIIFHDNLNLNSIQLSRGTQLPLNLDHRVQMVNGSAITFPENVKHSVSDAEAAEKRMSFIEEIAKSYLDIPYLWGGTSGDGIDCSGFAQGVYRQNGMELARDAGQQYLAGLLVAIKGESLDHLIRGDLIFFLSKSIPRITHIGISLGGYKFIHASGDGIVKINSLKEGEPEFHERSTNNFFAVKRIVI